MSLLLDLPILLANYFFGRLTVEAVKVLLDLGSSFSCSRSYSTGSIALLLFSYCFAWIFLVWAIKPAIRLFQIRRVLFFVEHVSSFYLLCIFFFKICVHSHIISLSMGNIAQASCHASSSAPRGQVVAHSFELVCRTCDDLAQILSHCCSHNELLTYLWCSCCYRCCLPSKLVASRYKMLWRHAIVRMILKFTSAFRDCLEDMPVVSALCCIYRPLRRKRSALLVGLTLVLDHGWLIFSAETRFCAYPSVLLLESVDKVLLLLNFGDVLYDLVLLFGSCCELARLHRDFFHVVCCSITTMNWLRKTCVQFGSCLQCV